MTKQAFKDFKENALEKLDVAERPYLRNSVEVFRAKSLTPPPPISPSSFAELEALSKRRRRD